MNPDQLTTTDHDLLVELRVEMKGLRTDVKALTDDTKERLTRLEESKIDKDTFIDHTKDTDKKHQDYETRLRFLERYAWGAIAIIGLVNIALGAYVVIATLHPHS